MPTEPAVHVLAGVLLAILVLLLMRRSPGRCCVTRPVVHRQPMTSCHRRPVVKVISHGGLHTAGADAKAAAADDVTRSLLHHMSSTKPAMSSAARVALAMGDAGRRTENHERLTSGTRRGRSLKPASMVNLSSPINNRSGVNVL